MHLAIKATQNTSIILRITLLKKTNNRIFIIQLILCTWHEYLQFTKDKIYIYILKNKHICNTTTCVSQRHVVWYVLISTIHL